MTPSILRRNNRPAVLRGAIAPSAGLYPSGAATSAGTYNLSASVVNAPFFPGSGFLSNGPNAVTTDTSRMASLFNTAAQQLGVQAVSAGAGSFVTSPVSQGSPARTWSLPITLNAQADSDVLLRALARAIYWSSQWFYENGNQRTPIPQEASDGGSGLANTLRSRSGGASFAVAFRAGTASNGSNVVLGSVPGSSTPPPGPVGGDSIVPIGGPGQMSVADLLSSFCNKRPKDSEGALTPRDRQEYQAALTRLGFSTQGIDGIIGGNTRAAVQSFQRSRNITTQGQSGYGTIGPQTQAAIIAAVCQGVNAAIPPPLPATPTTPAPTMPLPETPTTAPAPTPRPSSPSTPQPEQPLANTQPPVEAGMGAGPMLLLAAAGAAAVFLYTQGSKKGKGVRS